jgi:hypothetical protein
MQTLRSVALALTIFSLAAPASAATYCFEDTYDNVFLLKDFKIPKRPGKLAEIKGFAVIEGEPYASPLSGAAVANDDLRVTFGVRVHNLFQGDEMNVGGVWTPGNDTIPTHFDSDGDGEADSSDQWSEIDCDTVVLP